MAQVAMCNAGVIGRPGLERSCVPPGEPPYGFTDLLAFSA